MCSVFGIALHNSATEDDITDGTKEDFILGLHKRGRDGFGYVAGARDVVPVPYHQFRSQEKGDAEFPNLWAEGSSCIGNFRAEPTTEYVKDKRLSDQQPYTGPRWSVVHNGTIANDRELRLGTPTAFRQDTAIDSAAISELLETYAQYDEPDDEFHDFNSFAAAITRLQGSYAIIAMRNGGGHLFLACNYRPLYYALTEEGVLVASTRDCLPHDCQVEQVPPYSLMELNSHGVVNYRELPKDSITNRALVVCSGGMDSVVAAYAAQAQGYKVELVHFTYGSRAEGPEVTAIKAIADHMGVPLWLKALPVYDPTDSPLLQADSTIAGGEQGAEYAHEWVPARNLVMLAVATAMAEAKGFQTIVLGNNLEEAGAYPDNEPEFINKFNAMLPYAVGDGKRMKVIMPVGNMMKHEIVALGESLGAPMHLTWSCYRAGGHHCGKCGPCFMRKTAYTINGLKDPMEYDA